MNPTGSIVALITPFDLRGRVDRKRLHALVRWQIEQGTEGIVCSGTTGEGTSLSEIERKTILKICLEAAEKKIPIFAGTGTADTRQSVRLTEQAQQLGASGCLVITPYYNKPTQRGCLLHFQAISCVGLPMIIYNNPGRTVVQLSPETIAEIALLPSVVAIKESTATPGFVSRIRSLTPLTILAGDDTPTFSMLQEGALGAISVIGNVIPAHWKQMIRAARSKDWKIAKEIYNSCLPLLHAFSKETNPQCVKYAVSLKKQCLLRYRLPLVEPAEAVREEIKEVLFQTY